MAWFPSPSHAKQIVLNSPVLSQRKLRQIISMTDEGVTNAFIDLQYDPSEGLEGALRRLCREAEAADVVIVQRLVLEPDGERGVGGHGDGFLREQHRMARDAIGRVVAGDGPDIRR